MEKKSIGAFIAVLRKSQGMTQRELAEKLGVSDKAVSRWERDKTAPDLSLVPALADVFGVTCDEILRGERSRAAVKSEKIEASSEKQLKQLAKRALDKQKRFLLLSVGLALLGVLLCVALIWLWEPIAGFMAGLVFDALAGVILAFFSSETAASCNTEELNGELILSFKRTVYTRTLKAALIIAAILCFELALFLVPTLTGLYALVAPVLYGIIYAVSIFAFNKKYGEALALPVAKVYNEKLLAKLIGVLFAVAAVLLSAVMVGYNLPIEVFAKGETFETYEEFQTFMRNYGYDDVLWISYDGLDRNVPNGFDERYQTCDESEFLNVRDVVYEQDENGEYTDIWHYENEGVVEIEGRSYDLPIKCHTSSDYMARTQVLDRFVIVSIVIYAVVFVALVVVYLKKRKKRA